MTEGKAKTPAKFWKTANKFGFTFNWAYVSREQTAFFSSGLLPERPAGLDRRLPTLGTGKYEWKGYLSREEHPHDGRRQEGLLLNWNNQSAPGFMHGDDEPYGSVQRVELFDQWPAKARDHRQRRDHEPRGDRGRALAGLAVVSRVLRGRPRAERARPAGGRRCSTTGSSRDAPRLDADVDGTLRRGRPGDHGRALAPDRERGDGGRRSAPDRGDLERVRGLGGLDGESYVDKDLRTPARRAGAGPLQPDLLRRRATSRAAARRSGRRSTTAADELEAEFGSADPATWRGKAAHDRLRAGPARARGSRRRTARPSSRCSSSSSRRLHRRTTIERRSRDERRRNG